MVDSFSGFLENDLVYGLGDFRHIYLNYEAFDWSKIYTNRYPYAINYFSPSREIVKDLLWFVPKQSVQLAFNQSIYRHKKYNSILVDQKQNSLDLVTIIGRKSKAGINWAKEDQFRIHFNIDGIDMNKVVEKTPIEGVKSITGSELRYIYRSRDDPNMAGVVQFWKNGNRVAPPWVTDKPLWDGYKPKSSGRVLSTSRTIAAPNEAIAARVSRRASAIARDSEEIVMLCTRL